MKPGFEVARELGSALADLAFALPRFAWGVARRGARLREFRELQPDHPPAPAGEAPPPRELKRLILSCGDASGEGHALRVLEELRRRHPAIAVEGFGGSRLEAAGMKVWEPLADLNVMGFRDVLGHFPLFLRCVRRFAEAVAGDSPDAVLLIDYPGLNRHLLRIAGRASVPAVDFIAPQLWAWAPWRIRDFRHADRLLTILPFEGEWYRRRHARPQYVGHPLGDHIGEAMEEPLPSELEQEAQWVGILPGSRDREVRENLPVLLQAAAELRRRRPEVRFVLPHLRETVWPEIDRCLATAEVEVLRAPGCYRSVLPRLRAAWVASGTALLEVAARGVPPVLIYRVSSRLAEWFGHHGVSVPYIGALNLMAGREVAPEHFGRGVRPGALARDLEDRLDGAKRVETLEQLAALCPHFAAPGATARAVRAIEDAAARIPENKRPGTA